MNKLNVSNTLGLLQKELITWYETLIQSIPNFLAAIITMVAFIIAAKACKKIVGKSGKRILNNEPALQLLKTVSYLLVIAIGLFVSLGILNLEKTVTSLLAGAGVIGLALGFAFQEIASNFVSGIFIAFNEPYRIGDIVEIDNFMGKVTNINLRTTSITTFEGLETLIPNKYMFTKPLTNLTTTPKRRLDLAVGVSYGDDLDKAEKLVKSALEDLSGRIPGEDIEVFYTEFGSSSINFEAQVWVEYPGNKTYLKARHEAIKKIKKAFDDNNITIPFPIRTMDFGIKGGENLLQPLKKVAELRNA